MENLEETAPENIEGGSSDTTAEYECSTAEKPSELYETVKERLFHVGNWKHFAGFGSADFTLCDSKGEPVDRPAKKGDYFRISIPGPGLKTGDGFDWVKVEKTEEEKEGESQRASITVRPASNPQNSDPDTAHFFDDHATSTFLVQREGRKLTAAVMGRNEKPNLDVSRTTDQVRNAAVAVSAITMFSKIQWKKLVNGLLTFD